MPPLTLSSLSIESLRSARFDAWTSYQDIRSRLQENKPDITVSMVEEAEAHLSAIDAEMTRRKR